MSSKRSPSPSASASPPTSPNNLEGLALVRLRPYQREIAAAVLDSVFGRKGLTFSVEIARQGARTSSPPSWSCCCSPCLWLRPKIW